MNHAGGPFYGQQEKMRPTVYRASQRLQRGNWITLAEFGNSSAATHAGPVTGREPPTVADRRRRRLPQTTERRVLLSTHHLRATNVSTPAPDLIPSLCSPPRRVLAGAAGGTCPAGRRLHKSRRQAATQSTARSAAATTATPKLGAPGFTAVVPMTTRQSAAKTHDIMMSLPRETR